MQSSTLVTFVARPNDTLRYERVDGLLGYTELIGICSSIGYNLNVWEVK